MLHGGGYLLPELSPPSLHVDRGSILMRCGAQEASSPAIRVARLYHIGLCGSRMIIVGVII
ncbi:hypothetical protein CC80DRAFT_488624 [Byssothecium circinans]|uniref:Uncharacterized protein n=1 Tax=Byssothecium circinans TaxID=147558 RepID=A0A6A5UAH0_9PLEO|nr:hypothetical protein CC80DRAFT_488624 [Byssothecium circinans]